MPLVTDYYGQKKGSYARAFRRTKLRLHDVDYVVPVFSNMLFHCLCCRLLPDRKLTGPLKVGYLQDIACLYVLLCYVLSLSVLSCRRKAFLMRMSMSSKRKTYIDWLLFSEKHNITCHNQFQRVRHGNFLVGVW